MQRDPQTRLRRRRASGDLVMARQPTYGSGLNELDNMLSELDRMSPAGAHSMEQAPRPGRGVVGAATTPKNCVATDRYGRRYRVVCP